MRVQASAGTADSEPSRQPRAGNGEAVDGCIQLVRRALRRASAAAPVVFHLPRIESWAVHCLGAPAATDDSQADATSPAATAHERGVGHVASSPFRCAVTRHAQTQTLRRRLEKTQ